MGRGARGVGVKVFDSFGEPSLPRLPHACALHAPFPALWPFPQVDFFTSPAIKQMFRGWVQTLVTRVNTINGRTYKDDPTIMAWVRV
jgi:hypothetical protein